MALQQRRPADFSLLYDAYAPALYRVILGLVNDTAWAEDLLQDTFIKVWLNSQCYDPGQGRLFAWMVTIARNVALDALRAQKARRARSRDISDADEEITHPNVSQGVIQESLLSNLAPKHRTIVDLLYCQGYTSLEVATQLNMPLGTVKTRARFALQQLRTFFRQDIHYYQAGQ